MKILNLYACLGGNRYKWGDKGKQSIQKVARNLVDYEDGKIILDTVMGIQQNNNTNQLKIAI